MTKESVYSAGQVVRLKSGGPEMTVQKGYTDDKGETGSYRCQWFAGKKLENGTFPADSLEIVQQED